MVDNPLAGDLDHVLEQTGGLWDALRKRQVFITGGTGFFGSWLLESFAWANRKLSLGAQAVVLTRDPAAFANKAPHLAADPAIRTVRGDVRTFEFPNGDFPFVIHAASPVGARLKQEGPLQVLDAIFQGTRRVLDFAAAHGTGDLLLTSSGAVYGPQPPDMSHVGEDFLGGPDSLSPASAYGQGKRLAEFLCAAYARPNALRPKIARCFAFMGPYLPVEDHYAAGDFIRDALAGGPIRVQGDGTPLRSYLYAADLAIWLWTILIRGAVGRAYNVGSSRSVSIRELADTVASVLGPDLKVSVEKVASPGSPRQQYVPSVDRACRELNLREHISLEEAIVRTARRGDRFVPAVHATNRPSETE